MTPRPSPRPAPAHGTDALVTRRTLLRGLGGLGAVVAGGGLLAACGGDGGGPVDADGNRLASVLPPEEQALVDLLNETLGLDRELTRDDVVYNVAFASFEVLTGSEQRVPFALFDGSRRALPPAPTRAWLLSDLTRDVVAGPVDAPFYAENLGERGVYVAQATLERSGVHLLVVEREDAYGFAALTARSPAESIVPVPGEALEPLETPTEGELLGLETLCTNTPPCPMHERSFAEVRAAGRPAVVSVATPAFCSSAICAPTIDLLTGIRDEVGTDDVDWIHAEVFTDAGNTPAPYVGADGWALPTEPWTFVVDGDGVIVDRFDGPLVGEFLKAAVARVTS